MNTEYARKRRLLIGEELRRERRIQDKTLKQVADAVGLKENTISAYEKGKVQIPLDNLDAICTYLNIDYLELLREVQQKLHN